jgi:hypothetical protein
VVGRTTVDHPFLISTGCLVFFGGNLLGSQEGILRIFPPGLWVEEPRSGRAEALQTIMLVIIALDTVVPDIIFFLRECFHV